MKSIIHAIILSEGKILLIKKDGKWTLPSGSLEIEDKGSVFKCLLRIIKKELPVIPMSAYVLNKEITGKLSSIDGDISDEFYNVWLKEDFEPPQEILNALWIGGYKDSEENLLSEMSKKVVNLLRLDQSLKK